MSGSNQAVFQNQRSFGPPTGQQAYVTAGTFSWVAPSGVTKVSVVAVGPGGKGGGGLGYTNNISVTPGCSYTLVVGNREATDSYFSSPCVVKGARGTSCAGGTFTGTGGGNGGSYGGGGCGGGGAGGAGGYSGNGGMGGNFSAGSAGAGGAGGGGGSSTCICYYAGAGGGGVGILGSGSNGAGGSALTTYASGGGGGSGGTSGGGTPNGAGGTYGGGTLTTVATSAVRIIWPGCARSFPSTRTANE